MPIKFMLQTGFWSLKKGEELMGKATDKISTAMKDSGVTEYTKMAGEKVSENYTYVSSSLSQKLDENVY